LEEIIATLDVLWKYLVLLKISVTVVSSLGCKRLFFTGALVQLHVVLTRFISSGSVPVFLMMNSCTINAPSGEKPKSKLGSGMDILGPFVSCEKATVAAKRTGAKTRIILKYRNISILLRGIS
jgi:hypothetical protein